MGADYTTVALISGTEDRIQVFVEQLARLSTLTNSFTIKGLRVPSTTEPDNSIFNEETRFGTSANIGLLEENELWVHKVNDYVYGVSIYSRHTSAKSLIKMCWPGRLVLVEDCTDYGSPKYTLISGELEIEEFIPDTWYTISFEHNAWIVENLAKIVSDIKGSW